MIWKFIDFHKTVKRSLITTFVLVFMYSLIIFFTPVGRVSIVVSGSKYIDSSIRAKLYLENLLLIPVGLLILVYQQKNKIISLVFEEKKPTDQRPKLEEYD